MPYWSIQLDQINITISILDKLPLRVYIHDSKYVYELVKARRITDPSVRLCHQPRDHTHTYTTHTHTMIQSGRFWHCVAQIKVCCLFGTWPLQCWLIGNYSFQEKAHWKLGWHVDVSSAECWTFCSVLNHYSSITCICDREIVQCCLGGTI